MQLKSLKDTQNFSKNISRIISAGDIIFLYGEIGVGKTTFVRFFINYLESKNGIKNSDVLSPTFNIVYDYDIGNIKILHYDLYRLKNYKDISQLGMFETSKDHIKIVEWPELIELKPKDRIDILFQYSKLINSRKVKINGFGKWKDYKFNEL
jgi:tRNA threonylcarbamoyladenosine biosynthesis protein TsaE